MKKVNHTQSAVEETTISNPANSPATPAEGQKNIENNVYPFSFEHLVMELNKKHLISQQPVSIDIVQRTSIK